MVIYEFVKYVNFNIIIQSNLKIYQKILKLFKYNKVSDFRKEKLILNYSKLLLIVSTKIFVVLICILVFILTLNLLSNSYLNLVISFFGIIKLSIIFLIYHLVRKKFYAKL
mgnify:CR=1 FL=1